MIKPETIERILHHLSELLALGGWKLNFTSDYYAGIKSFEITISREM